MNIQLMCHNCEAFNGCVCVGVGGELQDIQSICIVPAKLHQDETYHNQIP